MENFDDFKPVVESFDDFAPVKPPSTDRATRAFATNDLPRQAGLTGRGILNLATSPVQMGGNFLNKTLNAANAALGGDPEFWGMPSEAIDRQLDKVTPTPRNDVERFTQEVAKSAPAFALPAALPAQVVGNAATGYAMSQKGDELLNTTLGAVLPSVAHSMANGLPKSKAAQVLLDKGVTLTPGQATGKGITHSIEQWAGTNPISAPFVRAAQRRALDEANVAAVRAVTDHVDKAVKLGHPPSEAIAQARELIGGHYDTALEGWNAPLARVESSLMGALSPIVDGNPMMTANGIREIEGYLGSRFAQAHAAGLTDLTGAHLKQIDSEIGQYVRQLKTSTNAADKVNAGGWQDLQDTIRRTIEAHAPVEKAQQLKSANAAYRQLLALEKALPAGADSFTPRQLAATLDRRGIEGTGLNTISAAMKETLPNTIPNSGTAERLIGAMLPTALIGGGYGANELGYPTIGVGLGLAGALGSKAGSRAMLGNTIGQKLVKPVTPQVTAATLAALRGKHDDKR